MTELIGKPLEYAIAILGAIGKQYEVKENFKKQDINNPIQIVTNAREINGKVELTVGEFYKGE